MSDTQTLEATDKKVDYYCKSDLVKVREAGGRLLPFTKPYDPEKFWNDFGEDFYKAFTSQPILQANSGWLIDKLKVLNVSTLLDVGCGFGRLLPFLLEAGVIKSANGVDISHSILKSATEYLNPIPSDDLKLDDYRKRLADSKMDDMMRTKLDELLVSQYAKRKKSPPDFRSSISLKHGDVRKLREDSDSYDCVLSSEFLQHLCPQDMEDALLHMVRASRYAILMVERCVFFGEHAQPDLWSHDYCKSLNSLGLNIVYSAQISNGLHGIVAIKR